MLLHSKEKKNVLGSREKEVLLWESMCGGEKQALNALFRLYYTPLFDYGIKIAGDEEQAKDAIQELFLKLWKKRSLLTTPQSIKAYLLVALRRILLREIKRKGNREERNRKYIANNLSITFTKEDLIIKEEEGQQQKKLLIQAVNQLSSRQKETLFLRYYYGLTNEEIADVMRINRQSVKNNLSRALKNVRDTINQSQLT
jgi:RNA polymerase sigma factor (sigma-70 family)